MNLGGFKQGSNFIGPRTKEQQKLHDYYAAHKDRWDKYRKEKSEKAAAYARKRRVDLKEIVYGHYGWLCNCCGETEPLFLSIDHVNNDGANHRRNMNGGKSQTNGADLTVYREIIRSDFPDTYQILCFNCNTGKHRNNGVCPHVDKGDD